MPNISAIRCWRASPIASEPVGSVGSEGGRAIWSGLFLFGESAECRSELELIFEGDDPLPAEADMHEVTLDGVAAPVCGDQFIVTRPVLKGRKVTISALIPRSRCERRTPFRRRSLARHISDCAESGFGCDRFESFQILAFCSVYQVQDDALPGIGGFGFFRATCHEEERHRPDGATSSPLFVHRQASAVSRVAEASAGLPRIMSAAFSAIMMTGALVLPRMILGMTDASTTRRPARPRIFSSASTTA